MALRLLEAHVPVDLASLAEEVLRDVSAQEVWTEPGGAYGSVVSAVLGAGQTGSAIDALHDRISSVGGLRALVLPLDAVLPRPVATPSRKGRPEPQSAAAVSREEVYASVSEGARLTPTFLLLTALATVVAAVGLTWNDTAAVIGAMVVAPLLGPNIGLALGFTLGDGALVRDSLRSATAGIAVALATSLLLGLLLAPDLSTPEIAARTEPGLHHLLLALAAGCAGTLAFTTGVAGHLVGVMVAVALLPPTVVGGLLLGRGLFPEAVSALLLALGNVAAILVAAMATFLWRGLRPRAWWEADRARQSAIRGLLAAVALLVAIAIAILGTGLLRL